MSYEISWYHEKRVLLVRIQGELTLEDMRQCSDAIYETLDLGTAPTHVIADLREIGHFPASLIALKNAARYLTHPKIGWIVVIGGPMLAQMFAGILTRTTRINYHAAKTIEEAIQLLFEADPSLVGLKERSE
jgi:hypothetical protein